MPKPGRMLRSRTVVLVADLALPALLLTIALSCNSLSLIGLSIAGATLAIREVLLVFLPWRLGGERSRNFQFGPGKAVQAGNLLIALCAMLAGLWLAGEALDLAASSFSEITPLALAIAVTINALVAVWHGFLCYAHGAPADAAKRVLLRPRVHLFAMFVTVQVVLTIAVLAKDPEIAFWFDICGATAVSLFVFGGNLKLAWDCISDLIDRPLGKEREAAIMALLYRAGVQPEELIDLRTRRCGPQIFAELTLRMTEPMPIEAAHQRFAGLRRALEAAVKDLDLVVKVQGAEP